MYKPYKIEKNFVILWDDNRGMSLTNAMEEVLLFIAQKHGIKEFPPVIYKDSCGIWDAVHYDRKRHKVHFISLNESSESKAKEKYKQVRNQYI